MTYFLYISYMDHNWADNAINELMEICKQLLGNMSLYTKRYFFAITNHGFSTSHEYLC